MRVKEDFFSKFVFYMHGIGLLLPWNAIMAAMDYFKVQFPSSEGYEPSFSMLVAVVTPMLLVQILTFFFLERMGLQFRITFTFAVNAVCSLLFFVIPNS